jgi:hypothetical protein
LSHMLTTLLMLCTELALRLYSTSACGLELVQRMNQSSVRHSTNNASSCAAHL